MTSNALAELGLLLPRIAEEGGDVESMDEAALVLSLAAILDDEKAANIVVLTVRRIFHALALLDAQQLASGRWQFASFPSLLLARSLLAGLGTDRYQLLDSGFWDSSDFLVDRQRSFIRTAEQRRIQTSESTDAIRRVWVSWALMAMDRRFLLVLREDPSPNREGSRGQFVLPGGRVNSLDLSGLDVSKRLGFFDPASELPEPSVAFKALEHALVRELHEELELESSSFRADTVRDVIAFTSLEGAKSAHAVTDYRIQLFRVDLTEMGKDGLLSCLAHHPSRFAWFTKEELAAGTNAYGDVAFVDALIGDSQESRRLLNAEQYDLGMGAETAIGDPVDIPVKPTSPLLIGATGHERSIELDVSDDALKFLGFLAAIRRGDPVTGLPTGVVVVPNTGWLIAKDSDLFGEMKSIAMEINRSFSDLVEFQGRAIRLNVKDVKQVYFAAGSIAIEAIDDRRGKTYSLCLARQEICCKFGTAPLVTRKMRVAEKLGGAVYGMIHGDLAPAYDNLDTVKRLQRSDELRKFMDGVGARLLIRQVDGVPELSASGRREPAP